MRRKYYLLVVVLVVLLLQGLTTSWVCAQEIIEEQDQEVIMEDQDDEVAIEEDSVIEEENILATEVPSEISPLDVPAVSDEIVEERLKKLQKEIKLEFNPHTKGFIDYFTVRNRRYCMIMERRQRLYFPIFEEYLKKHNMPEELKYLAIVESGLNPRAQSRVGAAGLWQFMPGTGKDYGLSQNEYIDERLDPYQATEAACKYLRELYNIFHDWELALASYNCGPGNVRRAIRQSGYKDSFWEVYRYLPAETRGYVPQFVAIMYTMNHLKDHNIVADSLEYPMAFDTLNVDHYLNLDQLCQHLNICNDELIKLNPSLKKNVLPENIGYTLRIPADKTQFVAENRTWLMDSCRVKGIELSNIAMHVSKSAPASGKRAVYVVKRGDVLGKIANRYHVSASNLRAWNHIRGNNIKVGQRLVMYKAKSAQSYMASSEFKGSKTKSGHVYYVQPGDTLWTIARKYDGLTIEKIKRLNNLTSNELKVGMKLVLG